MSTGGQEKTEANREHPEDQATAKAIMDARARKLAQPPPALHSSRTSVDVIQFALAGGRFAIEARCVREVIPLADYTPVPDVPDFFLGLTNLRGFILPILDLRGFFNLSQAGLTDMHRILVLGMDSMDFGLLVDQALEQQQLVASSLFSPEASSPGSAWIRGITEEAVVFLDGESMLKDERLIVKDNQ